MNLVQRRPVHGDTTYPGTIERHDIALDIELPGGQLCDIPGQAVSQIPGSAKPGRVDFDIPHRRRLLQKASRLGTTMRLFMTRCAKSTSDLGPTAPGPAWPPNSQYVVRSATCSRRLPPCAT